MDNEFQVIGDFMERFREKAVELHLSDIDTVRILKTNVGRIIGSVNRPVKVITTIDPVSRLDRPAQISDLTAMAQ